MASRFIAALLFLLLPGALLAQESCVWLQGSRLGARYDRPMPRPNAVRIGSAQPASLNATSVDFPNVNPTNELRAAQSEPSISIDPTNPNNMVIGVNDDQSPEALWRYRTTDGGLSWAGAELPPATHLQLATDPSVCFDRNGDVFFAYGRGDQGLERFPPNNVACYRSTDKGNSWLPPATVFSDTVNHPAQVFTDKYYMTVDRSPTSSSVDNVIMTWVEQQQDSTTKIAFSRSSDHGTTWTPHSYITPNGSQYQSPIPVTGPNGEIYVTFVDRSETHKQILFARSLNGGLEWDGPNAISGYKELGPVVPPNINGFPVIKQRENHALQSENHALGVNSFPTIAVDHSTQHNGRIYVSWAAKGEDDRAHVFIRYSNNQGVNWLVTDSVDHDTSATQTDKFFPWMAVDKKNGDVAVAYYDSREDPTDSLCDLYISHSRNGDSAFVARRISSQSFDPAPGHWYREIEGHLLDYFGDYIGLDVNQNVWHPAWTDSRIDYDMDIYTAAVAPHRPTAVLNLRGTHESDEHLFLQWKVDPVTTFGYDELGNYHVLVERFPGGPTLLPKGSEAMVDSNLFIGTTYRYVVRVISESNDTSAPQWIDYKGTLASVDRERDISKSFDVRAFPNPARTDEPVSLQVESQITGSLHLDFYGIEGRKLASKAVVLRPGFSQMKLELPGAGIYFFVARAGGGVRTGRIVVLR